MAQHLSFWVCGLALATMASPLPAQGLNPLTEIRAPLSGCAIDGVVSAASFGAVGDGVTDDTAAIQAAIDSLGGEGGRVVLGRGVYLVSDTIQVRAFVRLVGVGQSGWLSKGTVLKASPGFSGTSIVRLGSPQNGYTTSCGLRNLLLDGSATVMLIDGVEGYSGAFDIDISHVTIRRTRYGVHMPYNWAMVLSHIRVEQNQDIGFNLGTITSTTADSCVVYGGNIGFKIGSGVTSVFNACHCDTVGMAVYVTYARGVTFNSMGIENAFGTDVILAGDAYQVSFACIEYGSVIFNSPTIGVDKSLANSSTVILHGEGQGVSCYNGIFLGSANAPTNGEFFEATPGSTIRAVFDAPQVYGANFDVTQPVVHLLDNASVGRNNTLGTSVYYEIDEIAWPDQSVPLKVTNELMVLRASPFDQGRFLSAGIDTSGLDDGFVFQIVFLGEQPCGIRSSLYGAPTNVVPADGSAATIDFRPLVNGLQGPEQRRFMKYGSYVYEL